MADRDALTLPEFTLDGYRVLLERLREMGYLLLMSSALSRKSGEPTVFLRHDVDLHLEGALEVAAVEEALGVRSTWYIGTRLAYNPAYGPNAAVIRELAERGHTIGLHYVADQPYIGADVSMLDALLPYSAPRVRSWVMHEPSAGGRDYHYAFAENPHSYDIHYVSDSRMQWTEPYISQFLAGEPERAMLNTHHEHWLGDGNRQARGVEIYIAAKENQREYMAHLLKDYADAPA